MKFIHTSDWHLGRSFGPVSLRADQETFADWFVALAVDEAVDLVVIAGDLYDRAVAPTDAITLFGDTVGRLLDHGIVVAAITGNHDGADRVAPYDTMLDRSGFYLRGGYHGIGEVITHAFPDGDLDLVLLPYLEPRLAADDFAEHPSDADESQHDDADDDAGISSTVSALDRARQRRNRRTHHSVLATAASSARRHLCAPRSIAVSHAFVTGGSTSDSERPLTVGGTGEVTADVYDGFSYVALGHLHRPQDVASSIGAGADALRYSGSPLAYSFSEDHDKSVTIVEMDPDGRTSRRIEPVGVGRAVRTLTGTIDELLTDPAHATASDCFVRAVLTDRGTVLHAKDKLTPRFPHIVEIALRPDGVDPHGGDAPEDTTRLEPIDVARTFWVEAEGTPPDSEIDELLVDAVATALDHEGAGR